MVLKNFFYHKKMQKMHAFRLLRVCIFRLDKIERKVYFIVLRYAGIIVRFPERKVSAV